MIVAIIAMRPVVIVAGTGMATVATATSAAAIVATAMDIGTHGRYFAVTTDPQL
ncbi:hypothetical protein [Phyllobacterium phragmitis]|uniref:hypothetical protein n=1 Tax=Phyllobacterium phragmitis TaxID=2670329 RepID=UPI001304FE0C|nr:hypothetical protein [Phyllobacterium phragmitis]